MLMALTPGRWCDSRLTEALASGERFPVFCYGSNGIEQMRDRCRNGGLTSCRARLPDASRVFGGWSERWAGAVASVQPLTGHEVRGSVVDLDSAEIELLDSFEATNPDAPFTQSQKAYLLPQDEAWKARIDAWLADMEASGKKEVLFSRWVE